MNPETNTPPLAVKRSTAARLLDCSITTVHRLKKAGKLEVIKLGPGDSGDERITMRSIERLVGASEER